MENLFLHPSHPCLYRSLCTFNDFSNAPWTNTNYRHSYKGHYWDTTPFHRSIPINAALLLDSVTPHPKSSPTNSVLQNLTEPLLRSNGSIPHFDLPSNFPRDTNPLHQKMSKILSVARRSLSNSKNVVKNNDPATPDRRRQLHSLIRSDKRLETELQLCPG